MFAEASKHQEELSLVGTHGKLEAFAPAHGQRTDDPSVINFRRHTRNAAFVDDFDRVEPPAPEEFELRMIIWETKDIPMKTKDGESKIDMKGIPSELSVGTLVGLSEID